MSVDDICTLVNVAIPNLIWTDLISWVTLSCEVVGTILTQVKKGLYYDHYPHKQVFFSCHKKVLGVGLPQQFNSFFHQCANMTRTTKRHQKFLLYWCCIHFINKECWWLYWRHRPPPCQGRLLLQGGFLYAWSYIKFTSPFFRRYAPSYWWRLGFDT
jgi:hypothetical protein